MRTPHLTDVIRVAARVALESSFAAARATRQLQAIDSRSVALWTGSIQPGAGTFIALEPAGSVTVVTLRHDIPFGFGITPRDTVIVSRGVTYERPSTPVLFSAGDNRREALQRRYLSLEGLGAPLKMGG